MSWWFILSSDRWIFLVKTVKQYFVISVSSILQEMVMLVLFIKITLRLTPSILDSNISLISIANSQDHHLKDKGLRLVHSHFHAWHYNPHCHPWLYCVRLHSPIFSFVSSLRFWLFLSLLREKLWNWNSTIFAFGFFLSTMKQMINTTMLHDIVPTVRNLCEMKSHKCEEECCVINEWELISE